MKVLGECAFVTRTLKAARFPQVLSSGVLQHDGLAATALAMLSPKCRAVGMWDGGTSAGVSITQHSPTGTDPGWGALLPSPKIPAPPQV